MSTELSPPRIWAKIDVAPEPDLAEIVDVAGNGRYVLASDMYYTGPVGGRFTLPELRLLGDVTEVIEP